MAGKCRKTPCQLCGWSAGTAKTDCPPASECAPVGFLSCGPALLVVMSGWRCIPGAIGLLSLRKSSLLPRRLGGRRQDLALALFC